MRITVFTPTYNRANTLYRVYNSLINQTYKDFEWLIIDDGSSDNTNQVVNEFINENKINIHYFYQENKGKHIAINNAVKRTNSELFLIADSDDGFVDEALEIFVRFWDSIDEKEKYKGVTSKCIYADNNEIVGKSFPDKIFDCTDTEAFFKYKFRFEKWPIIKTEVLKEYPFPEPSDNLKFFPETILWQTISQKYCTRFIDIPLRIYYRDQDNATTKNTRYKENFFYWQYFLNNQLVNFKYYPFFFLKCILGHVRDSLLNNKKPKEIIDCIDNKIIKIFLALLLPFGWILFLKEKSK